MRVSASKITKRKDYRSFIGCESVVTRYFVVFYQSNDLDFFEHGITVNKKVGKAVVRNKYKRIIRVLIREYCQSNELQPLKINIIARRLIVGRKFSIIRQDFFKCLDKLKMVQK